MDSNKHHISHWGLKTFPYYHKANQNTAELSYPSEFLLMLVGKLRVLRCDILHF